MKTLALIALPVTRLPDDHVDADTVGMGKIDAPVGFRPTSLVQDQAGELLVVGLAVPNGVTALHRVLLLPVNASVNLPFGVEVGRFIGNCMMPGPRGLRNAQLFEYGKWPESTLVTGTLGQA